MTSPTPTNSDDHTSELNNVWPTDLNFNAAKSTLTISFDDGFTASIPYELLRIESPSAETRGHGNETPPPPSGKRDVQITSAEHVGRYAVRMHFSDGHDTGIYAWGFLYELGQNIDARMKTYLAKLKEAGGTRDT